MIKTINIKCPCGTVVNHVFQPDSWPKDKITRRTAKCFHCGKSCAYEIVNGRCTSRYL